MHLNPVISGYCFARVLAGIMAPVALAALIWHIQRIWREGWAVSGLIFWVLLAPPVVGLGVFLLFRIRNPWRHLCQAVYYGTLLTPVIVGPEGAIVPVVFYAMLGIRYLDPMRIVTFPVIAVLGHPVGFAATFLLALSVSTLIPLKRTDATGAKPRLPG